MNIIPSTSFSGIMLDLETLGVRMDSSIISIGAVKFNLTDFDTPDTLSDPSRCFYVEISPESWTDGGRKIHPSTVVWWMQQGEEARALFKDNPNKRSLPFALNWFCKFIGEESKDVEIWSNGSNFDVVLLRETLLSLPGYFDYPVKFYNELDVRTITRLAKRLTGFNQRDIPMVGTHHNALDDAKYQVLLVQECCRRLNPNKSAVSYVEAVEPESLGKSGSLVQHTEAEASEALFLNRDFISREDKEKYS